jgi:GLPGLI family protein
MNTIKILFLLLIGLTYKFSFAQNLKAVYTINRDFFYRTDNSEKKIASLAFKGFFFKQGGRTIFYKKPLYLANYPTGSIDVPVGTSNTTRVSLPMDTTQGIYYRDMDSLVMRWRLDISGGSMDFNYERLFVQGNSSWELTPEQKTIGGLKCQKAVLRNHGVIIWEVWFTPEIPVTVGPAGIVDIPGLVVEAYCIPWNETYRLDSYSTTVKIPQDVFWPAEFKQPFKRLTPMQKKPSS